MSGGVDSTTTAWLLKQQGHDVVGVMAKFWGDAAFREGGFQNVCCSLEAKKKCEAIAKKIGIPFYFLDLEIPFKEKVVDVFVESYQEGRTPNPCVSCNREVKIGLLLKKVQELFGVDYLATGHYAKIEHSGEDTVIRLSEDAVKDQTYFLARLRKEDAKKLLFPCGEYNKTQIREIAKKAGLDAFVSAESHELCFFSEKTPAEYLQKNIGKQTGDVIDDTGRKIGTHEGAYMYTLGQRKGLDLKIENAVYVSEIDPKSNTIKVTYDHDDRSLQHDRVSLEDFNAVHEITYPAHVQAKLRHAPHFVDAIAEKGKNGTMELKLKKPQRAVMKGQLAALYQDGKLVGGGEIVNAA